MPRGMVACKPCDRSAKAMNTTPSPVPPKHCADCVLRRQPGFTSVTPEQLACIESFRADITRVRAGQAVVPEHRA